MALIYSSGFYRIQTGSFAALFDASLLTFQSRFYGSFFCHIRRNLFMCGY